MIQLNYKEFGEGTPTIILHGLFGTLDNWQTIAKHLAEHYWIFIIDQRNHGRSLHDDTEMNYQLLADDLKDFMDTHHLYSANLIGHSMGGKTVMQFALQYPDMVNQLVVIDIAPKSYQSGHEKIFEAMLTLDLAQLKDRKEADEILGRNITDVGERQFLLKNLSYTPEGSFEWKMNLDVLWRDYHNIIADVEGDPFEGDTLFIRGGNSKYIQESDKADIYEAFPSANIRTIENAGHWVHAEQPKALLELLKDFLK
jgi:pimeloyl-ACP methyl ester carboxylesterase